jgi:hypothetical protein
MDEASVKKIHEARCYLSSLPDTLPATGPEFSANALLSFSLNPEWVEDVGEEGAVNQALEGLSDLSSVLTTTLIWQKNSTFPAISTFSPMR